MNSRIQGSEFPNIPRRYRSKTHRFSHALWRNDEL